jgi:tetratricopeptide (TPR) repeat protein
MPPKVTKPAQGGTPMRKYKYVTFILLLVLFFSGCINFLRSEDMRLTNKGLQEIKRGNYKEAENYLDKALSKNPNNMYAILNMGVVYFNTDRREQAREMFNKVIEKSEKEKATDSNEGWAVGKGLAEVAKKNLEYMSQ